MPEPPLQEIVDHISQRTIAELLELQMMIRLTLISRGAGDDLVLDTGFTKP